MNNETLRELIRLVRERKFEQAFEFTGKPEVDALLEGRAVVADFGIYGTGFFDAADPDGLVPENVRQEALALLAREQVQDLDKDRAYAVLQSVAGRHGISI